MTESFSKASAESEVAGFGNFSSEIDQYQKEYCSIVKSISFMAVVVARRKAEAFPQRRRVQRVRQG
ncbi:MULTISPECIES: hypothetical protein [unclassified Bosea (in: a-proteobacteria)]|uniref:hypothetical protein n=1 Tax=unclassified Bosea (in: a-proteobacteria) TaxID=2653178 RepID=UPI000F7E2EF4|nr:MULTISPECIES: hypothetical protein [unclassified Bosea (in: a-proteobacteria)]